MLKAKLHKLYLELVTSVYNIGFLDYNPIVGQKRFRFRDVRWLNMDGYKHGWFADPFVLDVTDKEVILLVEEFEYYNKKGRLCKLRVSRDNYKLLEVIPILTLDTHLSYPSIYRKDGKIFVCPENGESGKLNIYELEDNNLVSPITIIDEALADTQLLEYNGKFYAFGIGFSLDGLDITRSLKVYKSDSFLGPYNYQYSINNELREERGAGNIEVANGQIIRPAQICEGGYGRGVVLYNLTNDKDCFTEIENSRIVGDFWIRWGLGIHQIHSFNNLTVIDGRDYKYRLIGFLKRVRNKFNLGSV